MAHDKASLLQSLRLSFVEVWDCCPSVTLTFFAFASACSPLGAAVDAYHHADYPQASREFRRITPEELAPTDAGRFHLYCGLNHLALGNASLAIVHLTYARATMERDAGYFSLDERARLFGAWQSLGRMPGQSLLW